MLWRYSGSFAASDTAWVAAIAPMPKITPKPTALTTTVAARRGSFQRSRRRTAGAARNASRIAMASGISTSAARYSTAVAMTSAMSDERRARGPLVVYAGIALL